MKAFILAAGLGERMRPLTATTPKPLLTVNDTPLIVYILERLSAAGITEVMINIHHLGEQIREALGDGERFNLTLHYSDESQQLLGTGGGIQRALPWLGDAPFMVVSADIFTDYLFEPLPDLAANDLAHVVLVNNPDYHPQGDFSLDETGRAGLTGMRFTYANIAVLSPALFTDPTATVFSLGPLLESAVMRGKVTGEFYNGHWFNVGNPDILAALNQRAGRPLLGGCKKK